MNLTIINQPTNNRGDEAAHRSLMRSLNKTLPNAQICVLFIGENSNTVDQMTVYNENNTYLNIPRKIKGMGRFLPKVFTKYNVLGIANVFSAYRHYIEVLKKSNLVLCAPGGICMGGFQNWTHIFFLLLAIKYNKNVIYYSRSIGPFPEITKDNRIFKKRSIDILHRLKFISLRDTKSIQIADQLGIDCIKAIDTAFLDVPQVTLSEELRSIMNGDYVVFVPNSLTWHHAYCNASQDIIDNFYVLLAKKILEQDKNLKIVMLPQIFNDSKICDEKYFQKLKSKIKDERIIVLPETYSSDIQQKIISLSNLVIGTRYHSIVFAINNEIPFVALSYEHKMSGLLDMLNLSDRYVDVSKLGKSYKEINAILETTLNIINTTFEVNILNNAKKTSNKIAQDCFNIVATQF